MRILSSAAACLGFIGVLALVIIISGEARATNDPPPSGGPVAGDWTVTDSRSYNGCTITLAGNLVVSSTGTLVLDGARLVMDASGQGQFGLEVQSGGRLVVKNGSNLTSTSAAYRFVVREGGALNISQSEVRYCGYAWGSDGETAGIYLASDSCAMDRTLVTGGYYGIVVRGCSPAFSGCRFTGNYYGAGVVNSSAGFADCSFTYNINGVNLENCSGDFTGCTFGQNTGFGLLAYRSPANLSRCDLVSNPSGNCVLMGSDARFANCTFRDGVYGAYVTQGRPKFSGCTLTGNRFGMYFYKSSGRVEGCLLDRNSWYGVSSYYGDPSLVRCELSYTGYSSTDGRSYGTGLVTFSSNISVEGGSMHHNFQGVECRYSAPRLSNVSFHDNEVSVWAYQSEMHLFGCGFTREKEYGAHLEFFCTGEFEGCTFADTFMGAYLDYHSSVGVLNSTFRSCRYAVKLESCTEGALVRGCTFDRNSVGPYIVGSSSRIDSSRFTSNANASIMCFGSAMRITGNSFASSGLAAVQLDGCDGKIDLNTFESNNDTAIFCLDSRTEISNNTFRSNGGSGVHITGKRSDPQLRDNTFSKNEIGVAITKGARGAIHHNMFQGNMQVGISLSTSSGEIYCNTISGGGRGVSCDAASTPLISGNTISDNEGGVVCHSSSNAAVQDNLITNNSRFGIEVVGAWPQITGNTVNLSRDGIRVQGSAGAGTVRLRGNLVAQNLDGVWAFESSLELWDCNFTQNSDAGVYSQNGTCLATGCTFFENEDGLYVSSGTATASECDFIENNNSGVLTESSMVQVLGCFFFQNTDGVLDMGNSTLDVSDGVYEQNAAYAIYFGPTTRGSWTVERASSAVDDRFRLAGNLTVYSGASLRLTNATVFMMLESSGEHAIEVHNGGRLEMVQGCRVARAQGSAPFPFRVLAGGNLTFQDGELEGCGEYLGGSLDRGGLVLMSSQCSLRGVTFRDCAYGLIANGITGTFQYLSFIQCRYSIEAVASALRIDNSTIYSTVEGGIDVELQQASSVMLVNTTVQSGSRRPRSNIQGPGCELSVYWYLWVNVVWQNKVVAPRAQITLDDPGGNHQFAGYTDDNGWLLWITVLEYVETAATRLERNPYMLKARLGDVIDSKEHSFLGFWIWYSELQDRSPPVIQIDAPLPGAKLNYTPVTIRGQSFDSETGLERLEWSSDGGFFESAEGTGRWTVLADLDDGTHTVSIRATDAVGNRAVQNITFTVKTRITVLEVSSPAEGQITRSPATLVQGVTESDARVSIDGREVPVTSGRFSAVVYLSEGNNTLLVTASDETGNTATVTRRVVLDTQAPVIEVSSPKNDSYMAVREAVVSGRAEPGARVFVDGQPVINSEGRFTLSVDLPNETNLINVSAQDTAGNLNTTILTVHVDMVPPPISIGFPRTGQHFGRRNITLNGTTEPFATVTAGDFFGVAGADGAFRMNVTLLYGNNTLIIRSTDRAGNFNTVTWHIVRDRPPAGAGSPWIPALIAIAIMFASENAAIYLYWRRRKGPARQAARSSMPGTPPEPPIPEAVAEPVPPEALPVGDEEPLETIDMK